MLKYKYRIKHNGEIWKAQVRRFWFPVWLTYAREQSREVAISACRWHHKQRERKPTEYVEV